MNCVACGRYTTEDRQVCPICMTKANKDIDHIFARALELSIHEQKLIEASGYNVGELTNLFKSGKVEVRV